MGGKSDEQVIEEFNGALALSASRLALPLSSAS